ncbi:MAG: YfhO family protein [Chitinophagaceae bacterium]
MQQFEWNKIKPHVLAVGLFLIIACVYCLPALQGMMVNMHDVLGWKGMAQQSLEFREKYGHLPLWTNSMFGGMPTFQIAYEASNVISLGYLHYIFTLFLPEPVSIFFLASICFYLLAQVLGARSLTATLGGIAYAYASYNAVIVAVGHTTKFLSMAYAPAVIAGLVLLTQRKYIWGLITTLLFAVLLVYQNHLQIVYYTFLICLCFGAAFFVKTIQTKDWLHFGKTAGLALLAGAFAVASFMVMLLPLNEYAKETMRGGRSELTSNTKTDKTKGGLDKDYAFNWSYGIDETLTLALPAFKGGSSGPAELAENSQSVAAMQEAGMPADAINYFSRYLSAYWGNQPGTSGPVYFGAVIIALFIIGLFIVNSWHKWWILAASTIGILLAWGSNFSSFNYFLFDYLPLYNKFRAPSMSLVIPQLCFPLLGVMALEAIVNQSSAVTISKKTLKNSFIGVGVLALVLLFYYFSANFKSNNDSNLQEGMSAALTQMFGNAPTAKEQANTTAKSIMDGLSADRKAMYAGDLWRVLFLMALTVGCIWLVIKQKIKAVYAVILLCIATTVDLLSVDNRYLKKENYIDKDEFVAPYAANEADLQIKKDTGYYRVFDQTEDSWQSSRCAYHHNSVGGYSPVKLGLFQDLIENQLSKGNMEVYNMLNTKYFISNDPQTNKPVAQLNSGAYGAAWFVSKLVKVNNANEEMKALDSIKQNFAVADQREISKIAAPFQYDSTATIQLKENKNDIITYTTKANTPQLAVFSEVFYPYGWKATIDGKEVAIARVNYLLRAVSVPAGEHSIVFEFKPAKVQLGNRITTIMSILSIIIIIGGLFLIWKKQLQ